MIALRGWRHGWCFRPSLAATVATALLVPLLLSLGDWQLRRQAQKIELQTQWSARAALPPLRLTVRDLPNPDLAERAGRHVDIQGRWQAERQILLDNQVVDGQAGYWVYTPLRVGADEAVLVNRGWVAADPRREVMPDVRLESHAVEVAGVAARPPSPGPFARQEVETFGGGLLRVQQIDLPDLSRRFGVHFQPWTLRLDAAAPAGYRRRWPPLGGLTPERHRAYAVQWFALAGATFGAFVILNLRRR